MIIVMSGIPGSGKSTTVKRLVAEHLQRPFTQADVVSADDFFTDDDGTYDFVLEARGTAHKLCFDRFRELCIRFRPQDLIIVDNTSITNKERALYIEEAALHGHTAMVCVIRCPLDVCVARRDPANPDNKHPIPAEVIREMARLFQEPRSEWTVQVFDNG